MTFESMIDTTPTPTTTNAPAENAVSSPPPPPPAISPLEQALDVERSGEETLVVKVLFGNDLRRTAFVAQYASLHEVCCKLFALDPASAVLKYQDEDGDKITMSSDDELKEACKLAKDKVLRAFIEIKQQAAPPTPPVNPPHAAQQQQPETPPHAPFYPGLNYAWSQGGMRGGFAHHRGGFGGRGFHAPPFHYPHHPHHAPPHMGGHLYPPLPPHAAPFAGQHYQPAHHVHHSTSYEQPSQSGVTATFSSAHMINHGVFSPADASPLPSHCKSARDESSPYARCWKERKHAIKQQVKHMKANCATEEDRQAFKQLKREMYREFRNEKKAFKDMNNNDKCEKKKDKCEKKDKKEKKCHKKEKKEKKDTKNKCERRENKLMARHVADVTIPDNSELPADTPVTKTWRLRNAGSIAWPTDSQLLFISRRGDDLNGPERVFVGAVEPQQEVEVSVTFVTPSEPGRYIGYYRMAAAQGKFGQRVWVSFIVSSPALPSTPMLDAPSLTKTLAEEQSKEAEQTKEGEQTKDGEQPSAPLLDVNME